MLMDALSTTSDEIIEGRVDINQAMYEVLMSVPNMPEDLAESITQTSAVGPDGEPLTDVIAARSTTGWLLIDGLTDLATMRQIAPHITVRGEVFRAQIVGYFEQGGPATRIECVVDGSESPPKVMFVRDLSNLGVGYRDRHLQPYRPLNE